MDKTVKSQKTPQAEPIQEVSVLLTEKQMREFEDARKSADQGGYPRLKAMFAKYWPGGVRNLE